MIVEDINVQNPIWNSHCYHRQNAGPLEEFIETYKLLVNNNIDFPTRPGSQGMSIIDLALTSPDLDLLREWEIPEEYPLVFDHKFFFLKWEDILIKGTKMQQPATKRWSIQNLLEDKNLRQVAKSD